MKKYRRIEITAFRRRVTIISGETPANHQSTQTKADIWLDETDSPNKIETESAEGQEILIERCAYWNKNYPNRRGERFLNKATRFPKNY